MVPVLLGLHGVDESFIDGHIEGVAFRPLRALQELQQHEELQQLAPAALLQYHQALAAALMAGATRRP
jgi:hypothetical protein